MGLNDISVENRFEYIDRTPAVSQNAMKILYGMHHSWDSLEPFRTCLDANVQLYGCKAAADATSHLSGSQDFLPWAPNQPDNWEENEDCVHLRGMDHYDAGKLNDDFCTSTKEFICKKGLTLEMYRHIPHQFIQIFRSYLIFSLSLNHRSQRTRTSPAAANLWAR